MALALLWLESLAAGLLFSTLCVALAARRARRAARIAILVAGGVICLAPVVALLAVSAFITFSAHAGDSPFGGTLLLLVGLVAGSGMIYVQGILGWPPNTWATRAERMGAGTWWAASWRLERTALAFAVFLFLCVSTLLVLDAGVKSRLALLKSEAGALASSVTPPRVPDAENAALVYAHVFEALEGAAGGPAEKYTTDVPVDQDDAELGRWLDERGAAIELARRAASMAHCDFGRDYIRPSVDMLLPELAQMRSATRVLMVDACYRSHAGTWGAALANITAMEGMAGHVGRDPVLISGLLALAIDGLRLRAVEYALNAGAPPRDLAPLLDVERTSPVTIMKRAMLMEEAFGLNAFADLASGALPLGLISGSGVGSSAGDAIVAGGLTFWRVFLLEQDISAYRGHLRDMRQYLAYPAAERESLSALGKRLDSDFERRRGILSSLLMPAMQKCIVKSTSVEAARRAARVGVAIAAYLADGKGLDDLRAGEHGMLDMTRLVPEYLTHVPFDPFVAGEHIKAVAKADGSVVVYSAGEDETDDGGTPEANGSEGRKGDVIFTLSAHLIATTK